MNWHMNWRNIDPNCWLLCMKWVADIMNMTSEKSLRWQTPLQVLTGQSTNISIALCFMFWDVVYVGGSGFRILVSMNQDTSMTAQK